MGSIFEKLQEKLYLVELEKAFLKKGFKLTKTFFIDKNKIKVITNKGDTIQVDLNNKPPTWKLNNLEKGEVFGESFSDVASEYEFEMQTETTLKFNFTGFKNFFNQEYKNEIK